MKINDEIDVKIEKMSNLGTGIAHVEGQVIFVEGACPEDFCTIKINKVNKNYANAKVLKVIEPSKHRVEPFCPMQKVCGACQLQHIEYDYQLKIKQDIVQDAINKIGGINVEVKPTERSSQEKGYRCKIQYPIAQTKVSRRLLAGYYKPQSHEVVNIKFCPIQPKICDEIIDFIRENASKYGIVGYDEKKNKGDLRHVVLRYSQTSKDVLVVLVVNCTKSFDRLNDFSKSIFEKFKKVVGVVANYNSRPTNVIMGKISETLVGADFIEEKMLEKTFKIGANTFFQVNPLIAENIFSYVKNIVKENFETPSILDAYAGVSAFGICLADIAGKVVSFEENKSSVDLAKEIAQDNGISNIEFNSVNDKKFFEKEKEFRKRKFDVTIIDPPRKGCSEETLQNIINVTKGKIIYVSCNPTTLARDLKYLASKGATTVSIQPFDMFCHTYHVESIAIVDI